MENKSFLPQDMILTLKDVGVLAKVWPCERVILGLRVCKWMNQELLLQVGKVLIQATRGNIQTKDVCNTLVSLRGLEVALANANASNPAMAFKVLEGMSSAAFCFGRGLVRIDFTSNHIGDLGAGILIDLIEQFSQLRCLELGKNDISNNCPALASALAEHCKQLTHLDLHCNNVGDRGTREIANGLKVWTGLTHLNLCESHIRDSGVTLLAEKLCGLTSLTRLEIGSNHWGTEGDKRLACALPQCSNLQFLNLAETLCWDSAFSAAEGQFALPDSTLAALCRCPALTHLDLHGCLINDLAARWLVAVLFNCKELTDFDLRYNAQSNPGTRALAIGLKCATALTRLDLEGNFLDEIGAKCLEDVGTLTREDKSKHTFTTPLPGAVT